MPNDDFLHSCSRVFIERCTSPEKSTKSFPKILLLATFWVTESIFSPAVSQKPKREVLFFLSTLHFDLEFTSYLEICVHKKLWHSVFSNMRNTKCAFDAKIEGAHSFGIILNVLAKVNFTKTEKVSFWMIRPIGIVLFKWELNEFRYYFNSDVLLILVHKHWIKVSFSGLLPDLVKFREWQHSKVRSNIPVCCGTFWKTSESWIQQCKLHIVFTGINHIQWNIF